MNKYLVKLLLVIGNLIIGFSGYSQAPTIGLLYYGTNVSDEYTLFTPEENNNAYLINNCGEKIREWTFHETPGATCYLLENGSLLRAGKDSLTIRDWNNNLVWSYATTANGINQNHDIEPLPNGNVLCIVSKVYTKVQIVAQGRNPSLVNTIFKLEKIVEIQPVGADNANIVWEWNFFNHFIQDFDNTKPNYGVVADHPELIDVNYNNNTPDDWTHCNSVDYNAALDQIIISSRHLSEIFIIDHSTTTAEAAGHTGGNSNRGGDFLWRWGNPQVYGQGSVLDQKLFLQHDAKWVEPGYPDDGKITVFNNEGDGTQTFSSIGIITPVISGGVYQIANNKFLPADFEWSWHGSILGHIVHETKKAGTQALSNGNFIVAETSLGQMSEIDKTGNLVWSYMNPTGLVIYNQFDVILSNLNGIFKAEKYPSSFIGFSGKDMSPQGLIEDQNSISANCISTSGISHSEFINVSIQNPVMNGKVQFNQSLSFNNISITDLNGKTVFNKSRFNGDSFNIILKPGMYFLQLCSDKKATNLKMVVQ